MSEPNLNEPALPLRGRKIALAVTGSIAAYKAADLTSMLVKNGADVRCILSEGATRFVQPLTFEALSQNQVTTTVFEHTDHEMSPMSHLSLADWCDLLMVAPATANVIAKLAMGMADDAATAVALSHSGPKVVAPAMESRMYSSPAMQANLKRLEDFGWLIAGPVEGRLASGSSGMGRMVEPSELLGITRWALGQTDGDLKGVKVVVTGGGTQEKLDAVRFIGNSSSGKMGYAIAEAARDRGAEVVLISGPSSLTPPPMVDFVPTVSVQDMKAAVDSAVGSAQLLIMAAAVSDFRAAKQTPHKLSPTHEGEEVSIDLITTEDVLAGAHAPRLKKVGFAAQTDWSNEKPLEKLRRKGLEFIVLNNVVSPQTTFGSDYNRVRIVSENDTPEDLPLMNKFELAHKILDRAKRYLDGNG